MWHRIAPVLIKLLPLVLVSVAAALWFRDVQGDGPFVLRNLLPLAVLVMLSAMTLWRGDGNWTGDGWRWPLGIVGFGIPALGLSIYLHYAYAVNLNEMFSESTEPDQLFRFLPAYTLVAGFIGFVIGWIVGRNV